MLAFLTFDDEAEQYLAAAVLRPGNVPATQGAVGVLRRLLALLRLAFPQARFLVRLDGGFATPEIFDVLDAEPRLDYVVAMAKNAVLVRHAEPAMAAARVQSEERGETEHVYTDVVYAARTWGRERRVVIKAEVVAAGLPIPGPGCTCVSPVHRDPLWTQSNLGPKSAARRNCAADPRTPGQCESRSSL